MLAFLPIIFVNSAGWFVFLGGFFALALGVIYRKRLRSFLQMDMVCLGTIGVIVGLNLFLVLGLHLKVPYVSAFKYNYSAVPFFCLLAASLVDKSGVLIESISQRKDCLIVLGFGVVGLSLLFSSLIESTLFLNYRWGFVPFGVDSVIYYGLFVFSEAMDRNLLEMLHFGVLILMALCMVLPSLITVLKRLIDNKRFG